MDYRMMFEPIARLYVPSGWCIDKNHIYFLKKEGFDKINNENDLFLAKEFFINECVFYAKTQQPISITKSFVGVVDVGCQLMDIDSFLLKYDVNFWLYKKTKKKSILIYEDNHKVDNPIDALMMVSSLMKRFSHGELIQFYS